MSHYTLALLIFHFIVSNFTQRQLCHSFVRYSTPCSVSYIYLRYQDHIKIGDYNFNHKKIYANFSILYFSRISRCFERCQKNQITSKIYESRFLYCQKIKGQNGILILIQIKFLFEFIILMVSTKRYFYQGSIKTDSTCKNFEEQIEMMLRKLD